MTVADDKKRALRFVLLIGAVSLFADFAYEGARSVLGPYLGTLGASALVVGVVTGFGELVGYGLRLVSGRAADRSGRYWTITLVGYVVQMIAVPALALAGSWPAVALLIIAERAGKATRNPPRDVMLSHAGKQMGGWGWAFGLHEALDQAGAMVGPLVVTAVLARRGDYRLAFATLGIPAAVTLVLIVVARLLYPRPEEMERTPPDVRTKGLPRDYWIYLAGAALVAAGFADFPLIAYHFQQSGAVTGGWVPAAYAIAMGTSGAASLVFGKLFDRRGIGVLVPLTVAGALFAPLSFFGGFGVALVGAALWGIGMGVHESIIPAAVAPMIAKERRASAYGVFTAGYGVAWFLGSALLGFLYDRSPTALVIASVALELAAIPFFVRVARRKPAAPLA